MADMRMRQEWQAFKKAHPDFEKSRNFKSDVGPQLDKFEQAVDRYFALEEAALAKLTSQRQQVAKIGNAVGAALKGYEAVVKELEAADNTIRRDFHNKYYETFISTYVEPYTWKIGIELKAPGDR